MAIFINAALRTKEIMQQAKLGIRYSLQRANTEEQKNMESRQSLKNCKLTSRHSRSAKAIIISFKSAKVKICNNVKICKAVVAILVKTGITKPPATKFVFNFSNSVEKQNF